MLYFTNLQYAIGITQGGEDYMQILTFPHFEDPNGLKRITVA